MNGTHPSPAPSLRELSSECETEGVSSDGSSGLMVYSQAHINSEIFDPLRSPKYTPSASLRSAAPSEREPGRLYHSTGCSLKSGVTGDFHRPYATLNVWDFTIHRTTLPQSRPLGVTAPSEREPGLGLHHSSGCSLKSNVTGDFHRPYEDSEYFTFHHTTDRSKTSGFHPGTIPGGAGTPRMGTSLKRN